MLNFCGHIEINAPVYLFNLLWMIAALIYLRTQNVFLLWTLIPLLLICMKLHPVALLFTPACLLLFINHYLGCKNWGQQWFVWKRIILFPLFPIYIAGAIAYFFVFKDYNDPRHLQFTAMEYDRLFLPLVSPEPPLDKYNMLSFNHCFDYFGVLLIWSPVAFFILVVIALCDRKKIQWNTPSVIITGISLILFASLFFVTNPLLSMQMDWDLFSFPAPLFLIFTVVLVEQLQHTSLHRKLIGGCLALSLLSIPAFVVHASKPMMSQHLESIGVRIFKTYYEWSTRTFTYALSLDTDKSSFLTRKRNLLEKLEPHAPPGKDYEYARLLIAAGQYELRNEKNYKAALEYFEKAYFYYPNEKDNLLKLMETHFRRGNFAKAYQYGSKLVELKHPNEQKALRIVIHCALEAERYTEALNHTKEYLKYWPKDEIINHIHQRLVNGANLHELKSLFAKGT